LIQTQQRARNLLISFKLSKNKFKTSFLSELGLLGPCCHCQSIRIVVQPICQYI
jgi:hypothetical protein